MVLNLEKITWFSGKYVDSKYNKVNPKPIGVAVIHTHSISELHANQDFENEAEKHLLELQAEDKSYNQVNAYTISFRNQYSGNEASIAYNFYRI